MIVAWFGDPSAVAANWVAVTWCAKTFPITFDHAVRRTAIIRNNSLVVTFFADPVLNGAVAAEFYDTLRRTAVVICAIIVVTSFAGFGNEVSVTASGWTVVETCFGRFGANIIATRFAIIGTLPIGICAIIFHAKTGLIAATWHACSVAGPAEFFDTC